MHRAARHASSAAFLILLTNKPLVPRRGSKYQVPGREPGRQGGATTAAAQQNRHMQRHERTSTGGQLFHTCRPATYYGLHTHLRHHHHHHRRARGS